MLLFVLCTGRNLNHIVGSALKLICGDRRSWLFRFQCCLRRRADGYRIVIRIRHLIPRDLQVRRCNGVLHVGYLLQLLGIGFFGFLRFRIILTINTHGVITGSDDLAIGIDRNQRVVAGSDILNAAPLTDRLDHFIIRAGNCHFSAREACRKASACYRGIHASPGCSVAGGGRTYRIAGNRSINTSHNNLVAANIDCFDVRQIAHFLNGAEIAGCQYITGIGKSDCNFISGIDRFYIFPVTDRAGSGAAIADDGSVLLQTNTVVFTCRNHDDVTPVFHLAGIACTAADNRAVFL